MLEFDAPRQLHPDLDALDSRVITPDYFKTMGIPIIAGRTFDERDTATAKPVGIIDERVAALMWPGENPIGKRFRVPPHLAPGMTLPWTEVIGVVGHVKHDGIDLDTRAQVYWNYLQRAQDRMVLVVRAERNVDALAASVINALHEIDRDQPVYDVRTMEDVVQRSLAQRWMNMTLVSAFAIVALLLCSVGLYGVIAFAVARQHREFGIRLALGASRREIETSVVSRGLMLVTIGSAAGLLLAAALTRGMTSLLFGVGADDVISFGSATASILAVAFVASYLPARRAAAVEPAMTLRSE